VIYVCEHHDEVLRHWKERDLREISLAHVDFHDDLRGLLVDRRKGVAYPIGALAEGRAGADPGNFLAHAVLGGRVRKVCWIHGAIGGRAWDAGIVRYESDLLATHHRIRHRLRGGSEFPLSFREVVIDGWQGLEPGERLSVDWDCFASILQDRGGIAERVEAFLDRLGDSVPEDTWVAYSPEYSHPSLDEFRRFLVTLGNRFDQPVEWLSPGLEQGKLHPTDVRADLPRGWSMRTILFLRRHGVY